MEFLKLLEKIRNPFFDFIFSLVTYCGDEIVFMAIAIILFWCVSKKEGYYILSVGFVGTIINQFLKLTFRIPRPWVKDPTFTIVESAREAAAGYSFPSGHTQNSVGTFGGIAYVFKQKWLRITCIVFAILVPFSRMYLGVHTPLDVGVSIGIALILIFVIRPIFNDEKKNKELDDEFKYLADKPNKGRKSNAMYVFLGCMLALSIAFVLYVELYNFPSDIDEHNYASGLKNAYTLLGAISGMIIAYPIEQRYIKFETKDKWYINVIKVALGLGLVLGIKAGVKPILRLIFNGHACADAFRYMIIVLFAVCVYPLLFPVFRKIDAKIIAKRNKQ